MRRRHSDYLSAIHRFKHFFVVLALFASACASQQFQCEVTPSRPTAFDTDDFLIGWYDSLIEANLAGVARSGANTVLPYAEYLKADALRPYLDRAVASGLRVIVEIPRKWIRTRDLEAIRSYVRELKDHRAVRAWYLADEPELHRTDPGVLRSAYEVISSEDPAHPVAIAFSDVKKATAYAGTSDVYMWDDYLLTIDTPPLGKLDLFYRKLRAASCAAATKAFWPVLDAYRHGEEAETKVTHRLPTSAEMRYMIFASLLERPSGLFFWWWRGTEPGWVDSVLSPILSEVRPYLDAIRREPLAGMVSVDDPGTRAVLFPGDANGTYVLFVINDANARKTTYVSLRPPLAVHARNAASRFMEVLEPYGVRAYEVR
jgi:hypothetical protein